MNKFGSGRISAALDKTYGHSSISSALNSSNKRFTPQADFSRMNLANRVFDDGNLNMKRQGQQAAGMHKKIQDTILRTAKEYAKGSDRSTSGFRKLLKSRLQR